MSSITNRLEERGDMQEHRDRWHHFIAELLGFGALTLLDQWTKLLSVSRLKGQEPCVVLKGVLEFYYLENRGAAFSMFQNAMWFFFLIALVVLVAIIVLLYRMPLDRRYLPMRVILVSIAAGAMGNLIDRITLSYVRDFIYFVLIDFPVFNVADIYVTVSVAALVVLILFYYKDNDFVWIECDRKKHTHGE